MWCISINIICTDCLCSLLSICSGDDVWDKWIPSLSQTDCYRVCKNRGEITPYALLLINMTLVPAFTAFVSRGFFSGTDFLFMLQERKLTFNAELIFKAFLYSYCSISIRIVWQMIIFFKELMRRNSFVSWCSYVTLFCWIWHLYRCMIDIERNADPIMPLTGLVVNEKPWRKKF